MSEKLTCCPKCGSDEGVDYFVYETYGFRCDYRGNHHTSSIPDKQVINKTGMCVSCGGLIKLNQLLNQSE